jgi:hypothetical protein
MSGVSEAGSQVGTNPCGNRVACGGPKIYDRQGVQGEPLQTRKSWQTLTRKMRFRNLMRE